MPSFWGWALATVSSATRACARVTVGCIAATVQALIKKNERTARRLRGSVMGTLLKRHIIPMEGERCRNFPRSLHTLGRLLRLLQRTRLWLEKKWPGKFIRATHLLDAL